MQMFGFDGDIFPFVLTSQACFQADSTQDCSVAARPNTNRWSLINVLLQQGQNLEFCSMYVRFGGTRWREYKRQHLKGFTRNSFAFQS